MIRDGDYSIVDFAVGTIGWGNAVQEDFLKAAHLELGNFTVYVEVGRQKVLIRFGE